MASALHGHQEPTTIGGSIDTSEQVLMCLWRVPLHMIMLISALPRGTIRQTNLDQNDLVHRNS